jgi:hypothetical protein
LIFDFLKLRRQTAVLKISNVGRTGSESNVTFGDCD